VKRVLLYSIHEKYEQIKFLHWKYQFLTHIFQIIFSDYIYSYIRICCLRHADNCFCKEIAFVQNAKNTHTKQVFLCLFTINSKNMLFRLTNMESRDYNAVNQERGRIAL